MLANQDFYLLEKYCTICCIAQTRTRQHYTNKCVPAIRQKLITIYGMLILDYHSEWIRLFRTQVRHKTLGYKLSSVEKTCTMHNHSLIAIRVLWNKSWLQKLHNFLMLVITHRKKPSVTFIWTDEIFNFIKAHSLLKAHMLFTRNCILYDNEKPDDDGFLRSYKMILWTT